jgi:hypothetical protein
MKIWFTGKILTGINIWLYIYWYMYRYLYITLVPTCGDMGIIAPEVYLILLPNNSVVMYTQLLMLIKKWYGKELLKVLYIVHMLHWNNSPKIEMFAHSEILSWFRANQSLLKNKNRFLINFQVLSLQATNANLIIWACTHNLQHSSPAR